MNIWLKSSALSALVLSLLLSSGCSMKTVAGNEVGVKEDWSTGVQSDFLPPKTYVINPFTTTIFTYPTSGQVFVMNGNPSEPFAEGRPVDPVTVNSLDNQQVEFDVVVTWRRDPGHVVELHKQYRDHIEERLIRPAVVNTLTTRATLLNAIDLYSGEKLNNLKLDVLADLRSQLLPHGVVIDSFVVERPKFKNQAYTDQIEQRQVFLVAQSRAHEEQLANDANALAAKSLAQAEANKQIVQAEAQKQVQILQQQATAEMSITQTSANAKNAVTQQEAESQKIVLAAKAEADRQVAISEATKQAELNRAVGIRAVGEAQAEANKLLLASYAVPGADDFVKIQVAASLAQAYSGVKGFLPEHATYNVLADDYQKSVSLLMGDHPATADQPTTIQPTTIDTPGRWITAPTH